MQYVSSTPATRLDVIHLQEKLDQQLQQRQVRTLLCCIPFTARHSLNCRHAASPAVYSCSWTVASKSQGQPGNFSVFLAVAQARETGICPVREELYSQCLDELIRQVTISCAERGLLLLRVRDEMRMTTAAYQVCNNTLCH